MAERVAPVADHKPYVANDARIAEFTPKAVIVGALFGLIFGASTVYLALKAGLTVSASIPIAVLSISLLKKLGGSTILENNIVQTIGSAGESIAAGVGYIIGPRIAGVLVSGGVLAWLGIIPLIASLVPADVIASQLVKLGYLADIGKAGAYGWDPAAHSFGQLNRAIYFAYVRQIGAGAVAAGGFITLLKTLPTIVASFKGSLASLRGGAGAASTARTERDLPLGVTVLGSLALVFIMALLPFLPGNFGGRLLLGILIVVFGFFFVTVASRIVGLIGTSSNPVSGMTIATLMATCLLFLGLGWTGAVYQPMALCVGGMVCIAAANAGATSQDLKTGFLVGATPRYQQIGLLIGVAVAALVIGFTVQVLDKATVDTATGLVRHQIGTEAFPAPQGTLMATLIRGLLAHNLDWQFVLVGVFLAVTIELCGVSPLSFAVGAYRPLPTTLPIFVGRAIKGIVDRQSR